MKEISLPEGYRLDTLKRSHPRSEFICGQPLVDDWLHTKALQHQQKHLSVTKVLLSATHSIVGFYTLATGQVDFGELPPALTRKLPKRALPVAVLAWLGVHQAEQGKGLGSRLLGQALRDAYEASHTFPFVAIVLDCVDEATRQFYRSWDFEELPGYPYRLFLSAARLEAMTQEP